ncbi:hypothetical protein ASE36_02820 [Rhizobium sp. Root274]|uniref:ABZJ_00895 family protein n=1 Tax=unclassified Rhizobium TaxID=2613769 RepID=UPI000714ACB7|nr:MULTISPECIES: ABZJ_00895 family protein [unclassified Rhizobium]KQW31224.1 hypothetical protein ASC71_02815 [Rhizobium sp. Root1240]KRD32769.1 hypothetical protein ASE36_02820 [Rhizobium sp. Root274]
MPAFLFPMATRYLLVSLAITVGLTATVMVLTTYGYMHDRPSSLSHIVVMGAGMWAGTYFAKQTGRPAEWRECFRIGAVLTLLQIALSAVLTVGFMLLPGAGLEEMTNNLSPELFGLLAGMLVFIGLLYWVGTAAFLRLGSKSAIKAKKA